MKKRDHIHCIRFVCAIQRDILLNGRKVNLFTGETFKQLCSVIDNALINKNASWVSN